MTRYTKGEKIDDIHELVDLLLTGQPTYFDNELSPASLIQTMPLFVLERRVAHGSMFRAVVVEEYPS